MSERRGDSASPQGDAEREGNGAVGNGTKAGDDTAKSLVRGTDKQVTEQIPTGIATREQMERFRELRTRMLSMGVGSNVPHFVTLVVPVTAGSGASFVARNLAIAFALQDRQVAILVDCNLRHPTQHVSFKVSGDEGGLFDFLDSPQQGIDKLVRSTAVPGLYLIPAGHPAVSPREYFSSQAMQVVMSGLRRGPCFVFLDGPPASGSPDARILSDLADFVVLVAGYGHDTIDGIQKAAALFDPAKFAGVVFNERE